MTDDAFRLTWFPFYRTQRGETSASADLSAEAPQSATTDCSHLDDLVDGASDAANFLKAFGHDGRLTILCHLMSGPKSVTELERLLETRQAVVSQQLARLRLEGIVSARREGQAIFYSILDPRATELLLLLSHLFPKNTGENP